jgi:hypothetical protein
MPSPPPTGIVAEDAATQIVPMLGITLALALAVLVLGLRAGRRPSP